MAFEFRLPDIGEGVVEGEIVRWLVKEGDFVEEDQPIVEVMTDKATVEITSPKRGRIARIPFAVGQVCPVGEVLVVIEPEGEGKLAPREAKVAPAAAKVAPSAAAAAGGGGGGRTGTAAPAAPPAAGRADGVVLATPATRKLAREMGVDIRAVAGTGPHGRITREDVERQARSAPGVAVAPAVARTPVAILSSPGGKEGEGAAGGPFAARTACRPSEGGGGSSPPPDSEERVPFRGVRKKIAEAMARSKFTAPHFTYVEEVDMTEVVALREEAKRIAQEKGVKLTYLPFVVKALIHGLRRFPVLNSSLDEAKGEIVYKKYYHIGIACQTELGLMVPVVKDAGTKTILAIAAEIEDLATRCRAGKARPEELKGSTFTITSTGNVGGFLATPIINYPEVAIVGVHVIKDRPVVKDGAIVVRKMMNLSLSFDHRVIDGQTGAEFTNVVKRYLEEPKLLLLESI